MKETASFTWVRTLIQKVALKKKTPPLTMRSGACCPPGEITLY
jgi:hypothetical protein